MRGEESKRVFDYRVVITNPNAVSEIEENKKAQLMMSLQQLIAEKSQSEEQYNQELEKLNDYYNYQWQDLREIRGNCLLNHYYKEYNMALLFNNGFMDGMVAGEEIYKCDIIGGDHYVYGLGGYDGTNAIKETSKTLQEVINGKQDTLISGTSIKTINGESLLGSGDIEITGGSPDLSDYQTKSDDTLNTTNKTVVGAINELLAKVQELETKNTELESRLATLEGTN